MAQETCKKMNYIQDLLKFIFTKVKFASLNLKITCTKIIKTLENFIKNAITNFKKILHLKMSLSRI